MMHPFPLPVASHSGSRDPGGSSRGPGGVTVACSDAAYSVILHPDLQHEVVSVAAILTEIIAVLEQHQASTVVAQAWTRGQAIILVCPKVLAKHYRNQLTRQYHLIVSLEAAGGTL